MARHEFWSCDRCDYKIVDYRDLEKIYVSVPVDAGSDENPNKLEGEFCQRCQMVVLAAIDALLKEKTA